MRGVQGVFCLSLPLSAAAAFKARRAPQGSTQGGRACTLATPASLVKSMALAAAARSRWRYGCRWGAGVFCAAPGRRGLSAAATLLGLVGPDLDGAALGLGRQLALAVLDDPLHQLLRRKVDIQVLLRRGLEPCGESLRERDKGQRRGTAVSTPAPAPRNERRTRSSGLNQRAR